MGGVDPQRQAVRETAQRLHATRRGGRSNGRQAAYLEDVGGLVREVAFILGQSGISWGDVARQVDQADDVMARLLLMDPAGTLEYALCSAVEEARRRF
ncbi:hypothetical protein [Arsenicicoccus bolidensis]|uniref:hypothetical protein n=1 Tax=Arsenicicoccus bolidensis TaxID=229480 RepID=UPI000417328B|nr:hypothetical protein [Arsenicicoccus bolidensis]